MNTHNLDLRRACALSHILPSIAIALTFACGSSGEGNEGDTSNDESPCYPTVKFADPRLSHQVFRRIGVPEMPLTVTEFSALWEGDHWDPHYSSTINGADFAGIRDLEGIQCLPLERFSCSNCPVKDLSPLAELQELDTILITGADAPDLAPLAEIETLRSVSLRGSGVTDASPLLHAGASLPSLREINLSDNAIHTIEGAPTLPGLHKLDLANNALQAAPPVAGFPLLDRLLLDNNPLTDLSSLAEHPALKELTVSNTQLETLAGLESTALVDLDAANSMLISADALPPTVERVDLSGNNLTAAPTVPLPQLSYLALVNNKLETLAGLNTPALENLRASNNQLTTLDGITSTTGIRSLTVNNNNLTDLAGVPLAVNGSLHASHNAITDLSGLSEAPLLAHLDVSYNPLGDLSTLPALTLQSRLSLEETGIESVAEIEKITFTGESVDINIAGNPISDFSPLAVYDGPGTRLTINASRTGVDDLTQALLFRPDTSLDLSGNEISDVSALVDPSLALESLDLSNNQITTLPPMAGISLDVNILDLSNNLIADLESFAGVTLGDGFPGRSVYLDGNALTSLSGLDTATVNGLKYLGLSNNAITDVSALALDADLTEIWHLDLSDNQITDIPESSWKITMLNISGNPIESVGKLRVSTLTCERCALTSFAGLADVLPELSALELSDNPISSLVGIEGASELWALEINRIAAVDFSPISATKLGAVSADDNGITDASPFTTLPEGPTISLRDNQITDISLVVELAAPYAEFDLSGNPVDIDLSLDALYTRCLRADISIAWEGWSCLIPNYESRPPAPAPNSARGTAP